MSLDRNDHFIFQMTIWYTIGLISLFLQIPFYFMNDVSIWISVLWFGFLVGFQFFSGTIKYVRNSSLHFFLSWRLLGRIHWWTHVNTGNFDGKRFKLLAQLLHWICNYPCFLFLRVNFDFFKAVSLHCQVYCHAFRGTFRIVHTWASPHISHSHISSHAHNFKFFSSLYFIIPM